jgi:hypothetical protein
MKKRDGGYPSLDPGREAFVPLAMHCRGAGSAVSARSRPSCRMRRLQAPRTIEELSSSNASTPSLDPSVRDRSWRCLDLRDRDWSPNRRVYASVMRAQFSFVTVLSLAACSPASGPAAPAVYKPDERPVGEGGVSVAAEPTADPTDAPEAAPSASAAPNPAVLTCTEANCMDGLGISMSPEPPKAGTYSITVAAGSQSATCEVIFPYPPCGTTATKCSGTLPMMAIESGCELPKDKQTFPKVGVGAAPEEVRVTVTRGKTKLVDKKVKPTYEEIRPNGPKCGPVCHFGKVEIPWQATGTKPK